MNRRGFLGMLGMSAAALALDPERLLWVPGKKTIFVPSVVEPVQVVSQLAGLDMRTGMLVTWDQIEAVIGRFKEPTCHYMEVRLRGVAHPAEVLTYGVGRVQVGNLSLAAL